MADCLERAGGDRLVAKRIILPRRGGARIGRPGGAPSTPAQLGRGKLGDRGTGWCSPELVPFKQVVLRAAGERPCNFGGGDHSDNLITGLMLQAGRPVTCLGPCDQIRVICLYHHQHHVRWLHAPMGQRWRRPRPSAEACLAPGAGRTTRHRRGCDERDQVPFGNLSQTWSAVRSPGARAFSGEPRPGLVSAPSTS